MILCCCVLLTVKSLELLFITARKVSNISCNQELGSRIQLLNEVSQLVK